jgi:Tfp pilus assembly protein PilF
MNLDRSTDAAATSALGRDISDKAFRACLLWLVVAGLILRAGYLVEHARSPFFASPTLDERYYVAVAKMLLAGQDLHQLHGFRPLLYPMFLAGFDKLGGAHGIDLAIIAQHLLGITAGVLVALLGARLFRHHLSGIIGGALYILAPVPLCFEGEILIESSYTFLVAAVLLLHFRAADALGWKSALLWLCAGALTALAAQARVNILVLIAIYPPLAVWRWWRERRPAAFVPLLGFAGALAMAIPWGVFNMRQSDHFHLLPGAGGINLYLHNRRSADGITLTEEHRIPLSEDYEDSVEIMGRTGYEEAMRAQHRPVESDPMAVSRYWTHQALEEIKADPVHWLKLVGKKLCMTFWNVEMPNLKSFAFAQEDYAWLRYLPVRWVVLLIFAPAGIWAAARWGNRVGLFVLLTYIVLYSGANLLFFFCDRYRYPIWPAMAVLAGGGLLVVLETIRHRRARTAAGLLATMGLMALISLPNWLGITLPSFSRDYLFRSMAWYDKGHFPEALSDVDESLKLDPDEVTAIHHRANVLLALHRLPEARQAFEDALKRSASEAVIWNDYGATLEALGQTNEALQAYGRAMDLVPPSKNAFLAAAFLQIRSHHFDEAANFLDRLEKLDPRPNAMALAMRSVLARNHGEARQADQLEQQARQLDPETTVWAIKHATATGP